MEQGTDAAEKAKQVTLRYYEGPRRTRWFTRLLESKTSIAWMKKFVEDCMTDKATHAVLAWQGGEVVGFWAVEQDQWGDLDSCGTYVIRRLRRQGVATRMWNALVKRLGGEPVVSATAVTRSGRGFLHSVDRRAEYPLDFTVEVD